MLWMRARVAEFTLVANSVVNIYVDLLLMLLSVLFLFLLTSTPFSGVVFGNSLFFFQCLSLAPVTDPLSWSSSVSRLLKIEDDRSQVKDECEDILEY